MTEVVEGIGDNSCPICRNVEGDDLVYSYVLDCFVHLGCIEDALLADPKDAIAQVFAEEFDL